MNMPVQAVCVLCSRLGRLSSLHVLRASWLCKAVVLLHTSWRLPPRATCAWAASRAELAQAGAGNNPGGAERLHGKAGAAGGRAVPGPGCGAQLWIPLPVCALPFLNILQAVEYVHFLPAAVLHFSAPGMPAEADERSDACKYQPSPSKHPPNAGWELKQRRHPRTLLSLLTMEVAHVLFASTLLCAVHYCWCTVQQSDMRSCRRAARRSTARSCSI